MKPSKNRFTELAYQVDRKLLHLEEEDYYRLDIPAQEKLKVGALTWVAPSFAQNVGRFLVVALLIFTLLFSITNARSYGKILMASVQDYMSPSRGIESQVFDTTTATVAPTEENGFLALDLTPTSYEDRISIPSLEIDAPIVEPELGLEALVGNDWNTLENQIRDSLLRGVVHYPGTAEPGQEGNAFLTGHSSNVFWQASPYNSVFALLPRIQIGDDIFITYNQQEFHYRVTATDEVSPRNTEVLEQGDQHQLTLMTCTPVGTVLRRLIVKAELLED